MLTPTIPGRRAAARGARGDRQAVAVESEAVDDGLVPRQPEHARTRVALLRLRHDAAELHEAEAEGQELIGHLALLVEACREADGIGKGCPNTPMPRRGSSFGAAVTGIRDRLLIVS
jgi:hypothetical protein